jgi:branched-chain amino acid transport system permease protein
MNTPAKPKFVLSWEAAILGLLLLYPLFPMFENLFFGATKRSLGDQLPTVFIFVILAYGLNVVVGYTGLLHMGIAAFFALGAYVVGVLTTPVFPFQWSFWVALPIGVAVAALFGVLLGTPTLRLRGDYLALVTLGFGEVTKFTLLNLEELTAGTKGLSPVPPPAIKGIETSLWSESYLPFYYLALGFLLVVTLLLRNLERSRLGRAWIALREDELAANCMGLNPSKLKLAAFALGAGIAGLAGVLYATRLTSTANPNAYDFNRSIFMICCLILGGLGSRLGVLVGVFLLVGFDTIVTPIMDTFIQANVKNSEGKLWMSFTGWRLAIFGLALILMMRFRPEGLIPSTRMKHELHPDERVTGAVSITTIGKNSTEVEQLKSGGPRS